MMSQMYQEVILDYYKHPRNKGSIDNPSFSANDVNTLCGDEIKISAKVEDHKITDIKFLGDGCAISLAATSMLTEFIKGKSIEEVKNVTRDDILNMLNIPISPARLKCAFLGLKVLKIGAYKHIGEELSREEASTL